MGEADRNAQFEKISGKVQATKEKTTAAWQKMDGSLSICLPIPGCCHDTMPRCTT